MKFLIITQYFPPEVGAAQTRLAATSRALQGLGHSLEVVTAMPNYPEGKIAEAYQNSFYRGEDYQGARVHRFWLFSSQGKALGRLLAYLSLTVTSLAGIFKVKKPDVVLVNSGPLFLGLTGFIYSRFWGVPMVFYVADLWPRSVQHLQAFGAAKIFVQWALSFEAWIYKESKYVVAVTEGVRDILLNEKKLAPEKVLFLPNGVDTEVFHPRAPLAALIEKYDLKNKKAFVYAGNHGFAHALDTLIQTAVLLKDHSDIVFLLIGGGSEKNRLQKLAADQNVKNVIFIDPVSPVVLADYLQVAYMGLIHVRNSPLAQETRPAKMFPVMAMGKAVLYAGFGEGAILLESCGGGWVVPSENPQALKEKILELCQQEAEVAVRGQKNLLFVQEKMNFTKLVGDWLKTLKL